MDVYPATALLTAQPARGQTPRAMHHSALLNVMIAAARKTARALKRDFGELEKLQVSLKGPANFVSSADRRAEETLYQELSKARPGYGFLGEEGGSREGTDKSHRWIVDPLDGTTNFLHGIPQFAISIGLEREGSVIAGLVYNPASEEMFIAEKGKGAFMNEQRIRVAGRKRLADAIDRMRSAAYRPRRSRARAPRKPAPCRQQVAGLRRFGAAALDLAWIAAGRLDGYWERDIKPWDMAAGSILVREAGGFVSDCDGGAEMFAKGHIVAGNEAIQKELLRVLKAAGRVEADRNLNSIRRSILRLRHSRFFLVTGLCHIEPGRPGRR